jgi:hypothetical protein
MSGLKFLQLLLDSNTFKVSFIVVTLLLLLCLPPVGRPALAGLCPLLLAGAFCLRIPTPSILPIPSKSHNSHSNSCYSFFALGHPLPPGKLVFGVAAVVSRKPLPLDCLFFPPQP